MKRTRHISLIIALLSVLGIAAQQQQQSQYALYNYRNDGDFNAWLNIDVDSITYSNIGLDSVEYDNIVTQEVWTPDSCYRIPIEAIDSIGFRAPEPVYKDNIFHIRQYHMPYILKAEGLTLSINNGIARDSIPAVGQIVISDVIEEPLPRGFSGRVLSVEETSEAYIITCEAVALTDIFERLLIVGRSESFTPEEIQQARRKASPDDTDWDGVVPFEFPKFSLNIPSVEGFVSNSKSDMTLGTISITPKFYVSYIADIRPFVHSYVKVLFENKSKVATEMHLKVSGESPVTETKRASVYLTKVPIPLVTGVLYGEVAVSGDLYLKGNLDLKASFSNNIYNGDEYEWSTSDFWNITHTRYDKDPKKAKKGDDDNDNQWQSEVTLSVNGSFGFGASLDLVLFAVSENTLEISNTTTVGPELSGSLQFSSEGLKDGTLYSTLKNTNVTFTPLKLSDDVKFNICNREFTLGSFSHSFGSKQFKLFPDFEPLSLLKKYTPGDYSQLPLGIYTKVTNDVIPIIPLKLGIGRYDQYDNLLEESFAPDFYQYADEWDNKKLYFDMSSLPAGESYTFHPLIRIWGLKALQLKAMPSSEYAIPQIMSLDTNSVTLQKGKTAYVAINDGWGDFSAHTSMRMICDAEIATIGNRHFVKIVAKTQMAGPATVTVKDLRSGETKTILVTVSNDAVPEEFTLSEQTVSLQEEESATVLVTSGSGNYTAESSNENVATATVEDDMITIMAISIGSAVITVTDTETEETATIEVTVKGETTLVSRIIFTPKKLTLKCGESADLLATILPLSAENKDVVWSSSNPEVAVVSGEGRNALVTAVGGGSCSIICSATDGSNVFAECPVTVPGGSDYVDLGLPSGTLWATCNIGANTPEEYGDYFAWGETETKSDYLWTNYRHCKGSSTTLTKYCWNSYNGYNGFMDNKRVLDPEDDAATVNWGSNWQMPSKEQMEELISGDYVQITWATQNDIKGMLFTSNINGNSLFLPAAGYCSSDGTGETHDGFYRNQGVCGDYWSRSIDIDNNYEPYYRAFYPFGQSLYQRYFGRSVRPVRVKEKKEEREYVDLGLPSGTLWATCNVGASTPEEYGDYFAWGETEPKSDYSWNTYKYSKGSSTSLTKYCSQSSYGYNGFTDNLTELLPEDDAATVNWGVDWQTPSREQWEELLFSSYTTRKWTTQNRVTGLLITSKSNGKSIFWPAGGYIHGKSFDHIGTHCDYWSRSLYQDNNASAYYKYFNSGGYDSEDGSNRFVGRNIRPVRVKKTGGRT